MCAQFSGQSTGSYPVSQFTGVVVTTAGVVVVVSTAVVVVSTAVVVVSTAVVVVVVAPTAVVVVVVSTAVVVLLVTLDMQFESEFPGPEVVPLGQMCSPSRSHHDPSGHATQPHKPAWCPSM